MTQIEKILLTWLAAILIAGGITAIDFARAQQPGGAQVGPGSSFNASIENYLFGGPPMTAAAVSGGACSTGGATSASGDQSVFTVTCGTTTATTGTITWPVTRSVAPVCVVTSQAAAQAAGLSITTMNTTTLTWAWTTTAASTVWNFICLGPR